MSTIPKEKMDDSKNTSTRNDILVGQLPDDFLRIAQQEEQQQIQNDQELAATLQQQYNQQATGQVATPWASRFQAQLILTFVEAKLVKNYGLMNMSTYLRSRVGHTIYETKTSRGGKNPKWNEKINCYLPYGIDQFSIEIYDECMLRPDDLIAWASYKIPSQYLTDLTEEKTFQETIPLSGKQGDEKEGEISFVCTIKPITASNCPQTAVIAAPVYQPVGPFVYAGSPLMAQPVVVNQSPVPVSVLEQQAVQIKEEDVKSLQEMFPKIEVEVIKSVLTSERGNVDRSINNLLELNSTTEQA